MRIHKLRRLQTHKFLMRYTAQLLFDCHGESLSSILLAQVVLPVLSHCLDFMLVPSKTVTKSLQ